MRQIFLFLLLLIPILGFNQQGTINLDEEHFLLTSGGVVPFCATYQTIYDFFTTPPSDVIAAEQSIMVCGLIDDGVWTKLDIFLMLAQTTNGDGEALVNWVNPGTFDATAFNAPAFVPLEGFTGGVTKYINCNWNLSSDGVNYTRNSGAIAVYVRTDINEGNCDIGVNAGGIYSVLYVRVGGNIAINLNDANQTTAAVANSLGMFIASRTASNVRKAYKNKVQVISDAIGSQPIPDEDLFVLAMNQSGTANFFSTKQISFAAAGAGLTQTDVDNLTDRFEAYMDSNGKGVISESIYLLLLFMIYTKRKKGLIKYQRR